MGRTRAGHVHAGRIADGVNSWGAALCAPGLASAASVGLALWCRIASDARPRRSRGYRAERGHLPHSVHHQPPHWVQSSSLRCLGWITPFQVGGKSASWAGASRLTDGPVRAGPRTNHSVTPPSGAPRLTRPLACSLRHTTPSIAGGALHSQVTRMPLGRLGPLTIGRPRPRRDSDARGPSHPVPRHQVPIVTLQELDHVTRPSTSITGPASPDLIHATV